jgi:hypothetical protein
MPNQFQMFEQTEVEWCWAAVGASVKDYFTPKPPVQQGDVANTVFGTDVCTGPHVPPQFNVPKPLQEVLQDLNNLQAVKNVPLSFTEIQSQIAASLPVCVRIGWFGEFSGHFVVVYGWGISASGEPWVEVADPFFGNSLLPYDEFRNNYQQAGEWTDTFLVKQ